MEERDVWRELEDIRRMVRQVWIMVVLLVLLVGVPIALLGCMTVGVIAWEFLPH